MTRRIRIIDIALQHGEERFEEGRVLVVDGEMPLDLVEALQSRLDAGTAVDVIDDDALPPELVDALAAFSALAGEQHRQLVILIDLGLAAGPSGAAAIMAVFQDLQLQAMDLAPGIMQLQGLAAMVTPLIEGPAGGEGSQQDGPDAHADKAGSTGSEPGQLGSEASDAGGATDAKDIGGGGGDPPPPPPAPPSPAEKPAETKAARPRGSRSKTT